MREIVVRSPIVVRRGPAECAALVPLKGPCRLDRDNPIHRTDPAAVANCVAPGEPCDHPEEHHRYAPRPWWRRIRRQRYWEAWG